MNETNREETIANERVFKKNFMRIHIIKMGNEYLKSFRTKMKMIFIASI